MRKINIVAIILKVYGILNSIACVMIGLVLRDNLPSALEDLWVIELTAGIFVSFLIYACGEAIQLLQDIKNNTEKDLTERILDDELPEI